MNDRAPQGTPGDSLNWPMLKIAYPTDSTRVAALLPPGIDAPEEAEVRLTVYHFPVGAEPELGLVVNVTATYEGVEGEYSLAYAIDQEQAVFISRELWGQPKFLAKVRYFRLVNQVEAAVTHKGHTFFEYRGTLSGVDEPGEVTEVNEWWIKCARSVTMRPNEYDYPPRVVRVYAKYRTAFQQSVEGRADATRQPLGPTRLSLAHTGAGQGSALVARVSCPRDRAGRRAGP